MNNEQKNSRSHENHKIEIEKYINVWHTPWFPINLDCSKKNSCVSIFPNNYRLSESRKTKNPNPLINAQYIPKGTYKYCVQSSETVVAGQAPWSHRWCLSLLPSPDKYPSRSPRSISMKGLRVVILQRTLTSGSRSERGCFKVMLDTARSNQKFPSEEILSRELTLLVTGGDERAN